MQKYNTEDFYSCRAHEENVTSAMQRAQEWASPAQWRKLIATASGISIVFIGLYWLQGINLSVSSATVATIGEVLIAIGIGLVFFLALAATALVLHIRAVRREEIIESIKAAYPPSMDVLKAAKAVTGTCDVCEHEHAGRHVYLKPQAFDFTKEALLQYAREQSVNDITYIELQQILS